MTDQEYRVKIRIIYSELEKLSDHSEDSVKTAAGQLAGMNADLGIGRLEINAETMDKDTVKKELKKIESLDFEGLEETRNIEKAYDGDAPKEEWVRYARINRAELLLKQYTLLWKLRSDDPEAWDEVNELFFDD